MPFIKVYIHFVWSTKNRNPFLKTLEIREAMWQHIKQNAAEKGIFIDFISGYTDHCHCLISLGSDQTISKIMQLIKGESANWFNKQQYIEEKFQWQEEYFAVSVSESIVDKVRNYIKNQEVHHSKKSFQEEYIELIEKFGFKEFNDKTN
ncbi:IS200/IS605 family transposase [Flavobacterium sp. CBA20B-1]|uniref:IS200/IS605 family transposase n=1 Tax=unclassified Flavobacterium TaxID=196869 RepID=UPI0022257F9F|nr:MULTISPECIES: IS200/IS605 family transposase [unclassified Flavobacterium]WCM42000.1 IS200/IS605 family transposase [Flavobacterium sp. CBA20B-1]